jgi:hypothetical protein
MRHDSKLPPRRLTSRADVRRRSARLICAAWKKPGCIIELRRIFIAAYARTGTIKDLFKGVCEAGVALIEDGGVPGRDLEAAVSRALTDLLQVHPLIDGPAIPVWPAFAGREGPRQAR